MVVRPQSLRQKGRTGPRVSISPSGGRGTLRRLTGPFTYLIRDLHRELLPRGANIHQGRAPRLPHRRTLRLQARDAAEPAGSVLEPPADVAAAALQAQQFKQARAIGQPSPTSPQAQINDVVARNRAGARLLHILLAPTPRVLPPQGEARIRKCSVHSTYQWATLDTCGSVVQRH